MKLSVGNLRQSRALYANRLVHAHRERVPTVLSSSSPQVGSVLLRIPVSVSVSVAAGRFCLSSISSGSVRPVGLKMIRTAVIPVLLGVICARQAAAAPDAQGTEAASVRTLTSLAPVEL